MAVVITVARGSSLRYSAETIRVNRYDKDSLADTVAASRSMADVLRHYGLQHGGGARKHLQSLISRWDVDTAHWGSAVRRGGGHNRRKSHEVLVEWDRQAYKREPHQTLIRRCLVESGREETCEGCGLTPSWNGRPLKLQLDHINGDRWDNRPENLRFQCPNCHTQTGTWGMNKKPW